MKVAFTHNLRIGNAEKDAEFDSKETVAAIAEAIESAGHDVDGIEVSVAASDVIEQLESSDPDIIFNTAEGRGGPMREAFFPTLFEELGIPYTGSAPGTMALTLNKWMTKLVLDQQGIDTPRARFVTPDNVSLLLQNGPGLAFPIIVKPNFEGSSIGIGEDSVANDAKELERLLKTGLKRFPEGVLVEEYIDGTDIAVGFINGIGHDGGLLAPTEFLVEPSARGRFNIYDYRLKNLEPGSVLVRCPAGIPRDVAARVRAISGQALEALNLRDVARLDYRVAENGRIYLLEANALPSLNPNSSIFAASAQLGLSYESTVNAILNAAALRANVATASELGMRRRRRRSRAIRVGFTYNVKRDHYFHEGSGHGTSEDRLAEWDPPETIIAIANALAEQGHIVVHLEATPELPRVLAEADVDLVFNIAEGIEGRNREAQVPALCELLGIPYTGSDSATLAIALDKALCKKVLMQHDILTPGYQLMETGREKLSPDLNFPLIVKPNAEGSSKGIGSTNVVDNEEELRTAVKNLIELYHQPALVEEYIKGREFTVGLLGDKRPRVLPPMEIGFKDKANDRPVYDFEVKQEWEKHVYYECPAKVTEAETKAIEKIARATFYALDCRDVARVDLRMAEDGRLYVLEVNPLPGLTPDYSDLVLISQGLGMEYNQLVAEITMGGLKRLREKRRRERNAERGSSSRTNGRADEAATKLEIAADKAEKAAAKAESAATKIDKIARGRSSSKGQKSNGNGSHTETTIEVSAVPN
jgi:D-alanine-D-alanine ligase